MYVFIEIISNYKKGINLLFYLANKYFNNKKKLKLSKMIFHKKIYSAVLTTFPTTQLYVSVYPNETASLSFRTQTKKQLTDYST